MSVYLSSIAKCLLSRKESVNSHSMMQTSTLCPTSRLDMMLHAVDFVFQTSNHTTRVLCPDSIYYTCV